MRSGRLPDAIRFRVVVSVAFRFEKEAVNEDPRHETPDVGAYDERRVMNSGLGASMTTPQTVAIVQARSGTHYEDHDPMIALAVKRRSTVSSIGPLSERRSTSSLRCPCTGAPRTRLQRMPREFFAAALENLQADTRLSDSQTHSDRGISSHSLNPVFPARHPNRVRPAARPVRPVVDCPSLVADEIPGVSATSRRRGSLIIRGENPSSLRIEGELSVVNR